MSVEIARAFIQMSKFILENCDTMLSLAKLQNRQLVFENETNIRFDNILKRIDKLDLPKTALCIILVVLIQLKITLTK